MMISRIKDDDGNWVTDTVQIGQMAAAFYENLFTAQEEPAHLDPFLHLFPKCVSSDINRNLDKLPSLEEIRCAVFSLSKDSAAGPDGFNGDFFRSCWDIVGADATQAMGDFWAGIPLPKSLTISLIILIPKGKSPNNFGDFRPISLCTFASKIISKVMAIRLADLLPNIISGNQSGFVKGRCITDNILLASEMVHDINRKVRGGNLILKLDMMKAFDRVSHAYLLTLLRTLDFSSHFLYLIHNLLRNNWLSVLLNGQPHGFFHSTRGVKQGDPLSPLLFILSAELLSRGLNQALDTGVLSPFYLPYGCLKISHLAFADDVVIFLNGSKRNLRLLMGFLEDYQKCSGQLINNRKSSFYTSSFSNQQYAAKVTYITGFVPSTFPMTYLGC